MHMQIEINTLEDLPKLNLLMECCNMKVNKSQIARDLNVDCRTIDKYLKGYVSSKTRKRKSKIDEYYGIIKLLLSDETPQKFYYKRVLWQYLKDNHDLDCSSECVCCPGIHPDRIISYSHFNRISSAKAILSTQP